MENYEVVEHKSVLVGLGDNEFKSGVITLGAGVTAKAGTIVKTEGGKFVAALGVSGESGLGVVVEDVVNTGSSSGDIALRVLISGKVNQNALYIGSSKATAEQVDFLRQWSIVPVVVKEYFLGD